MKCLNCRTEFEAKRKTAKYCSAKCRVYANRSGNVALDNSVVDVTARAFTDFNREDRQPIPKSFSARKKK